MSEQVELTSGQECGDAEMITQQFEVEWSAIIRSAPAMDRLPFMVAGYYREEAHVGPEPFPEFQAAVAESVRFGVILLHRLCGHEFLNRMFEAYCLRFGLALEILMEDIEITYDNDEKIVGTYTPAQLCGRLFALLAMVIDTFHRDLLDQNNQSSEFDDRTGFYLDMNPTTIRLILHQVVMSTGISAASGQECFREGCEVVYGYIFHLCQVTKHTRYH